MIKIVTIVGARPQFIKAAVVSRAIARHNKQSSKKSSPIREVIVHTGQHFDRNMSEVFFEEMQIPRPDYHLDIHSLSHGAMTGQMLEKIENVLLEEQPDFVMVFGDTNTTLAGALAAAKLHMPVAHIEAGLRSYNRQMPEEINRVLTDHLAAILFCPTRQAVKNLQNEGIGQEHSPGGKGGSFPFQGPHPKVALVGDVMFDSALYYKKYASKPNFEIPPEFILATIHRAENTDNSTRLRSIFNSFDRISQEIPILLPLHPRTRKKMNEFGIKTANSKILITDPASYLEMIYLLGKCILVMTDSGGVQKEAFFFEKPCLTLRDQTEWLELVEHGYNRLCGAEVEMVYEAFIALKDKRHSFAATLYGDGCAGSKIVDTLVHA